MVSVCLTAYNGEKYIKEQLDSILCQLGSEDEVIISDDGSTDKTLEIINSYQDKRIKLISHKPVASKYKFSFTTYNFENALRYASGDYVFFADQDDVWKENKVVECVKVLEKGYDLVLHDAELIDGEGNIISDSYFNINRSKKGILTNLVNNSYLGCCMAVKKKYLQKVMPFPKKIVVPHDIWIGILYEIYGKVCFLNHKLIFYRRHGENVSPSAEFSNNSLLFKLSYRFNLVVALISKLFKNLI